MKRSKGFSSLKVKEDEITPTITLVDREVQGVSYEPVGIISDLSYGFLGVDSMSDVAAICSLCNEAQLEYKEGQYGRIGEPTEASLKVLVEKLGVHGLDIKNTPEDLVRQCNDYWSSKYERLAVLEFDRERKSMSVLCRVLESRPKVRGNDYGYGGGLLSENQRKMSDTNNDIGRDSVREGGGGKREEGREEVEGVKDNQNILLVKGAAEVVILRCNRIKLEDGRVVPITPKIREQLDLKLNQMARKPYRNLALAFR